MKGSITILAPQATTLINPCEEDVLKKALGGVIRHCRGRVEVVVAGRLLHFGNPIGGVEEGEGKSENQRAQNSSETLNN